MNTGIILKTLKKNDLGFFVLAKVGNKTMTLGGNIPKVPNGTGISLEISDGKIIDYDLYLSDRNKKLLEKAGIDIETFEEQLSLHKEFKDFGVDWNDVYKCLDNPYGKFPFKIADAISFASGVEETSERRLSVMNEIVRETFRESREEKYSFTEYIDKFRALEETGSFPPLDLTNVIEGISDSLYIIREEGNTNLLFDKEIREAYKFVRETTSRLLLSDFEICDEDSIDAFLSERDYLAEEQKNAVRDLKTNALCAITGGAGVGKTTTLKEIIGCYLYCGHKVSDIVLLAPTGKASRRMAEATGLEARTIDSALRRSENGYIYYNEFNKMPFELYLVDECSMIDILLMRDLLKAIPREAKVYLVGDCNQLFPVGCGEPYHDMIDSGKGVIKLTRNFRQGSDSTIYINGKNILSGKPLEEGTNFHIHKIKKEDIPDIVTELATRDYVDGDNQIIAPTNELVNLMNETVGDRLFPKRRGEVFAVGERVLFLKNTKDYYNGDTGLIVKSTPEEIQVLIGDTRVTVPKSDYDKVTLGFAITTHKSQGSEYDEISFFLPEKKSSFITRRLVYTGITRGKKHVHLFIYA